MTPRKRRVHAGAVEWLVIEPGFKIAQVYAAHQASPDTDPTYTEFKN